MWTLSVQSGKEENGFRTVYNCIDRSRSLQNLIYGIAILLALDPNEYSTVCDHATEQCNNNYHTMRKLPKRDTPSCV